MLEYLAQEFTPPNTVYVNQKVPSEFWVPGSHTISFSSHGVSFLLKIPIRSENHLPFLRLAMGKYGGDTPILRGETPKSKIHRKPHRNALCKAFTGMGSCIRVRFLGGVEPHFLVSILQMAPWVLPRTRGSQPSVTSRATSSTCTPLPTQASRPVHGGFITHVKVVFILHRQRTYPLEVSISW